MQHWDKSLIRKLLNAFDGTEETATFKFDRIFYNDRTGLRKYLKHLESKGYCTCHKYPMNVQKWKLTTEGEDMKQLLNKDCFI